MVAGSEKGLTYDDNMAAFSQLGFAPHVADHQATRDLGTSVMGIPISLPAIISPTRVQAVHPDGEVAVARAAAARGTIMGLSSFASKTVEEVTAANPNTFFQMYWSGSRDTMVQRMNRARAAGTKGLIATLDWSFSNGRDWGSPRIPERMSLKAMVSFAPSVLPHPKWARGHSEEVPPAGLAEFLNLLLELGSSALANPAAQVAPQPLTEREQEILELVGKLRSNREIALELHLGVNTVKWYLKRLFNALGVTGRQECVDEARRRHLLAPVPTP